MSVALTLTQRLVNWLNGTEYSPGHPISSEEYREELQLGAQLDKVASLDGTTAGVGSDLIGVYDSGAVFAGETLTEVLQELYVAATSASSDTFTDTGNFYALDQVGPAFVALGAALGGTNSTTRDYTGGAGTRLTDNDSFYTAVNKLDQGFVDLKAVTAAKGASLVGLQDAATFYAGTELEAALLELAVAIGGATSTTRNYSSNVYVTDNDTVLVAIEKLDAGAAAAAATAATALANAATAQVAADEADDTADAAQGTANTALANAATAQAGVTALAAENVDVVIPVDLTARVDISGVWTHSRQNIGLYRLRRSIGLATEATAFRAYPRTRTTASRGFKCTGFRIVYAVATDVLTELVAEANFVIAPATGAAPAAATSLGAVTWDVDHDTAGERGAVGSHTAVGTFATPVYFNAGMMNLELVISPSATATAVFDIISIELLGAETLVDAA